MNLFVNKILTDLYSRLDTARGKGLRTGHIIIEGVSPQTARNTVRKELVNPTINTLGLINDAIEKFEE